MHRRTATHLGMCVGISALHSSWNFPHAESPEIAPSSVAAALVTTVARGWGRMEAAVRALRATRATGAAAVQEKAAVVEAISSWIRLRCEEP